MWYYYSNQHMYIARPTQIIKDSSDYCSVPFKLIFSFGLLFSRARLQYSGQHKIHFCHSVCHSVSLVMLFPEMIHNFLFQTVISSMKMDLSTVMQNVSE